MKILDSIQNEVKEMMDNDSAHDFEHIMRVYKNAQKLCKTEKANEKLVCIGFWLGDKLDIIKDKKSFNVVYTIDKNHWNGNISLQLNLKDIKA